MSCTIKSDIEKEFNIELKNRNLLPHGSRISIEKYVNTLTSKMEQEGFPNEVFRLDFITNPASGGTEHILWYNDKEGQNYDAYSEKIIAEEANTGIQTKILFREDWSYSPEEHFLDINEAFDSPTEQLLVDDAGNFKEWKDNRVLLKKSLETQAVQLRKHNNDRRKLKLVNKAIEEVTKQINAFDENDIDIVHESLIHEVKLLNDLLSKITENPVEASIILESFKVKERINELSIYFNGIDLVNNGEVNNSLRELLENTFDKERLYDVQKGISNLNEKYNKSLFNVIEGIFSNDTLINEHRNNALENDIEDSKLQGKIISDAIDKFNETYGKVLELIKNKEVYIGDTGFGTQNLIGAASVDSVLSDLLFSSREMYYNQEVGQTQKKLLEFQKAWKIVKDLKIGNNFLTTRLYKKDALGVRSNELINIFTGAFGKLVKDINNTRDLYYKKKSPSTYKTWMNTLKNNTDFIQPYKLKSFHDKHKNNPLFKEYFKYSEEEMQEYEKELREKIGNTTFEIQQEKQEELINQFIVEAENNLFATNSHKYSKNPLAFITNFYSDNYNQHDQESFEYLEPSYTQFIPKVDGTDEYNPETYYNNEVKKIESEENGQELMDTYKLAYQLLTEYINPSLAAEGISLKTTELMNQMDTLDREILKDVSFFKSIDLKRKAIWNSILTPFTTANKIKEKDTNELGERIPFKNQANFNTKYSSYGKSKTEILKEYYLRRTDDQLRKELNDAGVVIPGEINGKPVTKKQMVSTLVQLELNKLSSTNIFSSIADATEIVRNMNARKNTMNIYDLFMQFIKNKDKSNDKEYKYLEDWGRLNLEKEKYTKDANPKFFEKSIGKTYQNLDRNIHKLLKNERDNLEGNYGFIFGEDKYIKKDDKYYKNGNEVSKKVVDDAYDDYTDVLLENTGVSFTLISFANGLLAGIYKNAMRTFSPFRYFLNRMAGLNQNMSAAVSKEFGYDLDQLLISRRFLRGDIAKKIIHYDKVRKILGQEESKRTKQMQTLLALAESLRILETSMESIKQEGDFGTQSFISHIDTALSNMAVNYPEWKNQMESLLSMLQNVEVENINGVKKKVFDGKDFIYVPGTLQLKDEFRTESNIANWEQFKADKDGKSPQNKTVALAKQAKRRTQGNYSGEDKIPLLGSELGRLGSVFTRYLFENTNRQYGSKKFDLTTYKVDTKGNKLILAEHAPTFLMHMTLGNGWVNTLLGGFMGVGAFTFAPMAAIVPVGIVTAMLIANRRAIQMNHLTKDEMYLSLNYATEVAARSLNILPNYLQLKGISENKIETLKYTPSGMTEAERNLISGSAQELAQKFGMFFGSAIATTLLTGVYIMLQPGDDEEKKLKMQELEAELNAIINSKNSMYSDVEKFTNPISFFDASTTFVYFNMLKSKWNKFNKAIEDYGDNKLETKDFSIEMLNSIGFIGGIPKAVNEIIDPSLLTQAPKAYQGKDWFDKYLEQKVQPAEQNYKQAVDDLREPVRNEVKNKFRDLYLDQGKEISEETLSELTTDWLRQNGYYKDGNSSYEEVYNDTELWNSTEEKINQIKLE